MEIIELELENDVYERLLSISRYNNITIDELIVEILTDLIGYPTFIERIVMHYE